MNRQFTDKDNLLNMAACGVVFVMFIYGIVVIVQLCTAIYQWCFPEKPYVDPDPYRTRYLSAEEKRILVKYGLRPRQ